jgi:hypothetical protein
VLDGSLSRYVKENTAPPSVKVGNRRRFHRSDLDAWIRRAASWLSRRRKMQMLISKSIPRAEDESQI